MLKDTLLCTRCCNVSVDQNKLSALSWEWPLTSFAFAEPVSVCVFVSVMFSKSLKKDNLDYFFSLSRFEGAVSAVKNKSCTNFRLFPEWKPEQPFPPASNIYAKIR